MLNLDNLCNRLLYELSVGPGTLVADTYRCSTMELDLICTDACIRYMSVIIMSITFLAHKCSQPLWFVCVLVNVIITVAAATNPLLLLLLLAA